MLQEKGREIEGGGEGDERETNMGRVEETSEGKAGLHVTMPALSAVRQRRAEQGSTCKVSKLASLHTKPGCSLTVMSLNVIFNAYTTLQC